MTERRLVCLGEQQPPTPLISYALRTIPESATAAGIDYCNRGGKRASADALAVLLPLVPSDIRVRVDRDACLSTQERHSLASLSPELYLRGTVDVGLRCAAHGARLKVSRDRPVSPISVKLMVPRALA
jgi:hypothetical protein